ncbi:MAG: flavin reductase family protein [Phycisphaerae bacterium]|jgi:flavin reductase (DIM6/NTAB) family NADH-FMN oxidoreductase RutF
MAKEKIDFAQHYEQALGVMSRQGLLLGSYDAAGKANLMTIGWGAMGRIWAIPVWIVLVRPTRYTYQCIEHSGSFTVNVPTEAMNLAVASCGSTSGRDVDKFAACKLTAEKGQSVLAPTVAQCPIVYECQVVHSNDILPEKLAGEIISGPFYMDGNYHRLYFGKILSARAETDAANLLGGK